LSEREGSSALFTRCLSCDIPFSATPILEGYCLGDEVAFDPQRGRLWAICRVCRRWTLAPLEERWEALEELECLARGGTEGADGARLLSRTDNVALFQAGPLRMVRVGPTDRREEEWWRYGRRLQGRDARDRPRSLGASLALAAAVVTGGLKAAVHGLPAMAPREIDRWLRFGDYAWRGHRTCAGCGHVVRSLPFFDRKILVLTPVDEPRGVPLLSRRCPRCKNLDGGGLHLDPRQSERTLRRVLAYEHHAGRPEGRVRSALALIEQAGRPSALAATLARFGRSIGDLPSTAAIAMDIAANEGVERRLLSLEVSVLQQYWRQEEELAAIVDGELTPSGPLDRIRLAALGEP
jgi:hypothetical protein